MTPASTWIRQSSGSNERILSSRSSARTTPPSRYRSAGEPGAAAARDDRDVALVAPREHGGDLLGARRHHHRVGAARQRVRCPSGTGRAFPREPNRRTRGGGPRSREELHDPLGDLLAARPPGRSGRRSRRSRRGSAPGISSAIALRHARREDRVGVAEQDERGPSHVREGLAHLEHLGARRMVGLGRHVLREHEHAGLRLGRRERRVVGRDDLVGSSAGHVTGSAAPPEVGAGAAHELAEPQPRLARRAARVDARVQDDEPRRCAPGARPRAASRSARPSPARRPSRREFELARRIARSTRSAVVRVPAASVGLSDRPKPSSRARRRARRRVSAGIILR